MSERTNAQYAAGLRGIADWYEAHPEAPQPHTCMQVFSVYTKEEAVAVARALGHAEKRMDNYGLFYLGRDFGGERLEFIFDRAVVCERRVIGTEYVPEVVVPACTREIVEWDCGSLLADDAPVESDAAVP